MAILRFRSSPAGAPLMCGPDSSTNHGNGPPEPESQSQDGRVTIEVQARPGATTIVVKGELDLVTRPFLEARLALAAQDRPARLIFDLGATHFMDCWSARLIAGAGHGLPGGRPVIRRPGPGVRRLLELTGLDAHCEIEELVVGRIRACLW